MRLERLPKDWFDYNTAFQTVTDFYSCADIHGDPDVTKMAEGCVAYFGWPGTSVVHVFFLFVYLFRLTALEVVVNLPATSVCCLGTLIRYLEAFKLTRVLRLTRQGVCRLGPLGLNILYYVLVHSFPSNLKAFLSGAFSMNLNASTVRNLEIFKNQVLSVGVHVWWCVCIRE